MKELINKKKVKVPQSKFKLSNGSFTTNKRAIRENFNNFFISVGQTLARKNPPQQMPPECYLRPHLLQTIYLSPVSENEIKAIVLSLKNLLQEMMIWLLIYIYLRYLSILLKVL